MSAQGQKVSIVSHPVKATKLALNPTFTFDASNYTCVSVGAVWQNSATPTGTITLSYSYDNQNWKNSSVTPLNLATGTQGDMPIAANVYPYYKVEVALVSGGSGDLIDIYVYMR